MMSIIVVCIISYLLGSIPNGLICGKGIWVVDLREHGSHNIGATNAWRTIGKSAGILIFALDLLKGAISVYLGLHFGETAVAGILCGILAIVGHSWSLFLGFKGGKGISATVGMMLVLAPKIMIITIVLGVIVIYFTRIVSIGSLLGNVALVVLSWTLYYPEKLSLCIGISLLLLLNAFSHRENIVRLFKGTESKMDWKHLSSRFKRTKSGKIIVPEEENTETK